MAWVHAIDQTNGYNERDPRTCAGAKEEVGWDDVEMHDHYNNKYFIKHMKYTPGQHWGPALTNAELEEGEKETAEAILLYQLVFRHPKEKYRIFSGETLLWTGDSEEEAETQYEILLNQQKPKLSMYTPGD